MDFCADFTDQCNAILRVEDLKIANWNGCVTCGAMRLCKLVVGFAFDTDCCSCNDIILRQTKGE